MRLRAVSDYLNYFVRLHLGLPTPFPQIVFLEATRRCNCRCQMCDIWRLHDDGRADLSMEEILRFLDDAQRHSLRLLNIYGGEPLLREDVADLVRACSDRGISTSLTTNGLLLDEGGVAALDRAGLGVLQVSLDSTVAEEHDELRGLPGVFDRAVRGLSHARRLAPRMVTAINFTLNRRNLDRLPEMPGFAEAHGVSLVKVLPMHAVAPQNVLGKQNEALLFQDREDTDRLKDAVSRLKEKIRPSPVHFTSMTYLDTIPYQHLPDPQLPPRCYAARLTCEVLHNGDVLDCLPKARVLGNLRSEKLSDIWRNGKAEASRRAARGCRDCHLKCYVGPALRYSPRFLLREPGCLLREYRLFFRRADESPRETAEDSRRAPGVPSRPPVAGQRAGGPNAGSR